MSGSLQVAAILNVVELIEKCELHSLEAIRFLADELGESFALDERISAFFRSLLEHVCLLVYEAIRL